MRYVRRELTPVLRRAARAFGAILVTGPRRSGKTTLLRHVFPRATYVLLEDPDVLARVRADPRAFLDDLPLPVILDEIQAVPELLRYVRARIDAHPRRHGEWLLTGSQEATLMQGVTESMAGRVAVLDLWPLSVAESPAVTPWRGGFPEVVARPRDADLWFASYLRTYLERDVRAVTNVRDLAVFRRFLALVAARTGQMLHRTELAGPLGVSVPTVGQWLSILEITSQVLLVPPFHENFGKRLVKSPRLYVADAGLACHLLGIASSEELERSPFLGPVYEGFVAAEIAKRQAATGRRRELYHFRDPQGLEVDLVVPTGPRRLALIEVKAARTVVPQDAGPVTRLAAAVKGYDVERYVVHRRGAGDPVMAALAPGVRAVTLDELLSRVVPRA